MNNEIIPQNNIRLQVNAENWREAMQVAGDLLVYGGYTTDSYTREMIEVVEELGPYIVVAPGLALAHSRPAPSVLKTGLSLLTLAEPVSFGSEENDPVSIIFGLCATDNNNHIQLISRLIEFLDSEENLQFLKSSSSVSDIYHAINSIKQGA